MNQLKHQKSKLCSTSECVKECLKLHEEQMNLLKCHGCPKKMKEIGQKIVELSDAMDPEEADVVAEHMMKKIKCECGKHD
jgi:hypothetical protein